MPKFYSTQLKSTLADTVEASLNAPVAEQLSLLEELALMRGFCGEAITLADAAMAADVKAKEVAILFAIEMLKHVAQLAEAATRIDHQSKDKVSVHDLNAYIHQIVRIAYETMPDKHARKFEKACRTQILVAKDEKDETNVVNHLVAQIEQQSEAVVTDSIIRRLADES